MDHTLHVLTIFMGFFAIMNPLGNVPIFIALVKGYDKDIQRKVAITSVVTAFTIVAIFSVFGHYIFQLFGITLPAFQIAGGLILFVIGYNMLNAKTNTIHQDVPTSLQEIKKEAKFLGITPLGIPILAGPGTISAAMNFIAANSSIVNIFVVVGIFLVMCILTFLAFISGRWITQKVDSNIITVISRIMGLILTIIAIQMLIMGIGGAVTAYQSS